MKQRIHTRYFASLSKIVTDPVSMERLLGQSADLNRPQPVEYCVVCGDKASGNTNLLM